MTSFRFAAVAAFAVIAFVSSAPAAVRAADRAPVAACCAAPCCAAPCCAVPGVQPATAHRVYPVTVGKRTVLASSLAPTVSATSCCCSAGSSCCAASGGACCAASAGCCVGCCAKK